MNLTGTWEGYVPGTQDLYYRGNNVAGFTGEQVTFESGQITVKNYKASLTGSYNLVGKNYLNIQGTCTNGNTSASFTLYRDYNEMAAWVGNMGKQDYTISINVQQAQISGSLKLELRYFNGVIYRIWLS